MVEHADSLDPRFIAGVDMVRRTGATEFQIRYDDEQDPVVWNAVACHRVAGDGRPVAEGVKGVREVWSVGAGLGPLAAVMGLCEVLIDGGRCAHCGRPAAFDSTFSKQPLDDFLCWTQWDPELSTFRRSCEGVAP